MIETNEYLDKYFADYSVKDSEDEVSFGTNRTTSYRVSGKELAEGIYFWDPVLRRFMKFRG